MPYRPQSAYPPPPPGWEDEEFDYYFDSSNTTGLANLPANQVPLPLQPDAEFHVRGIQISGNAEIIVVRLWQNGVQLSQTQIPADRSYDSSVQGAEPVGKLPVPLEPEVLCQGGSQLLIDVETY